MIENNKISSSPTVRGGVIQRNFSSLCTVEYLSRQARLCNMYAAQNSPNLAANIANIANIVTYCRAT